MPPPSDFLAQIKANKKKKDLSVLSEILAQKAKKNPPVPLPREETTEAKDASVDVPFGPGEHFRHVPLSEGFAFDPSPRSPRLETDSWGNECRVSIPLAPCAYRMTDYTMAKREIVSTRRCILKLNVLRCLRRECETMNELLRHRLSSEEEDGLGGSMEEEELGKVRFMELLSNCGVFQKVSELILKACGRASELVGKKTRVGKGENGYLIPQIEVEGLDLFLGEIERLNPQLRECREEIQKEQTVSFYPGLGELFTPGAKLVCHPEGMEGTPLGCSCVQSWYAEELNKATNKIKRRFVLVMEFMISVGDEVVFVACTDVYPEFHDPARSVPVKDLTHRKLLDTKEDRDLLNRLQQRGEFCASVATKSHYLEYQSDSFFPIISGGWSNNAVIPLSKGGRAMIDVKRGILEGHVPVRGKSDGMSDTVKEAIKLFEQSKRTGVAVPFRTAILPGFDCLPGNTVQGDSDRHHLWQAWPMLTGFSFTARVWGKLLLSLPKIKTKPARTSISRAPSIKYGVQRGGLGGVGNCGNCGYINFQEQAFDQLVLAEDKKELIRAVARNAGGGPKFDEFDEDDEEDDQGLDVVANKGAASIFLLHGPPGCGKTLTAEAIAELLKKPLYVVTAGDLGITASQVEKKLGSVLELCQTWDALVLIDEADVFLEERSSTEIERNALVCVMLRLLEYYSGCLFLSSNRSANTIDAAIASRITVMLSYPALDANGRSKVWTNLLTLLPVQPIDPNTGTMPTAISINPRKASRYRMDFSHQDFLDLGAKYLLNGRQIKNSIVLARALSRERGVPLSSSVLQRAVLAVAGEQALLPSS